MHVIIILLINPNLNFSQNYGSTKNGTNMFLSSPHDGAVIYSSNRSDLLAKRF